MAKGPEEQVAHGHAVPDAGDSPSGITERTASWRVPAEPRADDGPPAVEPGWLEVASASARLVSEISGTPDAHAAAAAIVRAITALLPRRLVAVRLGDGEDTEGVVASSRALAKGETLAGALGLARSAYARHEPVGAPASVFAGAEGYTIPLAAKGRVVGVVAVEPMAPETTRHEEACALALALAPVAPTLAIASARADRGVVAYLSWIVEQAPFPAAMVDHAVVVRAVNVLAAEALGTTAASLVGVPAAQLAQRSENAQRAIARLLAGEVVSGIELERALPNQRVVWVAVPLLDAAGAFAGAIAFGDDRSAVQILEEQILHAEKLATVGQLAAGIVHELNNPLTSISVYGDYLLQKAERAGADPADVERLRRIVEATARMLRFTRELVTYARPSTEEPSECSIDGIIDQSIGFVEHVLESASVRVIVDLPPSLPAVRAVRGQLHQVFVNLLTNATQAIAAAGRGGGAIRIGAAREGGMVRVRIADDGPGIPAEHVSRIFEPFFTTKEAGRGTGLGLSIVRNIVQLHGGTIHVESVHAESGAGATGTTFVLAFPVRRDG